MPTPRLILAALVAGALTGCTTYQSKDLLPAHTQAQFEHRSLRDPGLQKFLADHGHPATGEWDLARLTLVAFYFNPNLDVARAQLAATEAGVRTAGARPNPKLNFAPGYNQDASGGVAPWILGYALDVPLELAGQRGYRQAEARQQNEIARLGLASAAWSTRSAVRRALAALHAAGDAAALWREQKPVLAQAAQLVEAQVRAGEVSPLEASQARIALNRAELAARESDRSAANARSRLAEALGLPFAALADVRFSYQGLSDPVASLAPAEARTWAAQNRADLLAALTDYAATQSALQSEIARQYPDFSIGPGYQLDQGEGKWSLALNLTLPIFHQNQGPVAAAQANRAAAAARFIALQARVLAEVDRAATDYASALGDLETVKTMRTNLSQQAKTLRVQQSVGEISRLELARARIELADNSRADLEARVRADLALGAFEDAVQRPLIFSESAWRATGRTTLR